MVVGYHVVFGAYGFWLPNDPRGSWSDFVGSWELFQFGHATKTDERRSLAGKLHDHGVRKAAKRTLKYPAVKFTGRQAAVVATGFKAYAEKSGIVLWACSILPEHVHLVIRRHRLKVEQIVNLLKGDATRHLNRETIHPLAKYTSGNGRCPAVWARGEWKVFLESATGVERAIRYVNKNPVKEGKPQQQWSFVTPFDGNV